MSWDSKEGKLMTRFLDMPICSIATAEKRFELIDKCLSNLTRPMSWWGNTILYSVLSRVKEKQPNVFTLGCVCHLANLCLLAGVKVLPIDIDDFFCGSFLLF